MPAELEAGWSSGMTSGLRLGGKCGYCHRSGHTKRSCPTRCDRCCLAGHTKEECKTRQTTSTHLRKKYKERFDAVSQRLKAEKEAAKAKATTTQSNSETSESSSSSDRAENISPTETNNNESINQYQTTTDDNDSDEQMEDKQDEVPPQIPREDPHQSSDSISSSVTPTHQGEHTAESHEPADLPDTNAEINSFPTQQSPTINLGFTSADSNSQSHTSLSTPPSSKHELSEDSSTDNEHSPEGNRSPHKRTKTFLTIEEEVEVIETDQDDNVFNIAVEHDANEMVGASELSANSTNFIPPLQCDNLSAKSGPATLSTTF
ncbi:hypothetical protein WICPIJ_000686 [Wickerhamomyces pijperi]|uniref:CCHC-type domain-containing protein n=1 Tax=Wickerhamomyces pijperi TaxID=599730 RepID=A0A9P8TRE6_WICPI|nr:hypothetical protein WICPIJ_000686 [Wickerhamomyces pijperi]